MNFEELTHAASLNLMRAAWHHPRTKSCYRKDVFYLNKQPLIHILFLYTSQSPWNITKDATVTLPAEYNEQLHLCQIESHSFHTDSSQLRAQHCRRRSNHSNHFILLDDRAMSPRAKQRRAAASQVAPQSQMHSCRKHSGRAAQNTKAQAPLHSFWGWGLGRTRQPNKQTLQIKAELLHVILFSLSRNYPNFPPHFLFAFLWHQHHLKTRALSCMLFLLRICQKYYF